MGKPAAVAIGSKWKLRSGRVFTVLARRPFGIIEFQEEGKAIFGSSRQSDFLRDFQPV
jgi:hypothetical protein